MTGKGVNLSVLDSTKPFRLDHIRFDNSARTDLDISGHSNVRPRGLLDHNEFVNLRLVIRGTDEGPTDSIPGRDYQHQIWTGDPGFGDETAIYVEDNVFDVPHPGAIDANYGGAYVFRFNNVTVHAVYANEFHGVQGLNRAGQRWEIYGNRYINPGPEIFTAAFMRGGSGFVFNNTLVGLWGSMASLKVERSCDDKPDVGLCDGTKNIDGNTLGMEGYPCRDQIGRVQDLTPHADWSLSMPWPAQKFYPVYGWNNKADGTEKNLVQFNACTRESTLHCLENRDYYNFSPTTGSLQTVGTRRGPLADRPSQCTVGVAYWATDEDDWNALTPGPDGRLYKCTAPDTWTQLYTPYPYPHPLQS